MVAPIQTISPDTAPKKAIVTICMAPAQCNACATPLHMHEKSTVTMISIAMLTTTRIHFRMRPAENFLCVCGALIGMLYKDCLPDANVQRIFHEKNSYLLRSCQKATGAAAATLRESTRWLMGMRAT